MATSRLDDVPVEVWWNGAWHPGWLDRDDWRRTPDGWSCMVRFETRHPDGWPENRLATFTAEEIRRVGD